MDRDEFINELKENATFRGEMREFMRNVPEATRAAAHEAITAHNEDANAHGAGVKREISGKVIGWAGVVVALLAGFGGAIGAEVHKLWNAK